MKSQKDLVQIKYTLKQIVCVKGGRILIFCNSGINQDFIQKEFGLIKRSKQSLANTTGVPLGVTVNNGDKVAFEIIQGPKGPNAKITRVLEGVSAR